MKAVLICLVALLAGCAGISTYSIRPFYDPDLRTLVCCQALITNGKNLATLQVTAKKSGNDYDLTFSETGVSASAPLDSLAPIAGSVAGAVSSAVTEALKVQLPIK